MGIFEIKMVVFRCIATATMVAWGEILSDEDKNNWRSAGMSIGKFPEIHAGEQLAVLEDQEVHPSLVETDLILEEVNTLWMHMAKEDQQVSEKILEATPVLNTSIIYSEEN